MSRSDAISGPRLLLALGHLLFAGLLVLAIQHVALRTIHVDSACQIFKWINGHGLQFEAHRYAAFFPQVLVKCFVWSGVSLANLLLVASVAHVLVPWVIYTFIGHGLRMPWMAAAVALAAVLCSRLTFYGIVLEVNYLLCYPFLLAAALEQGQGHPAGWRGKSLALFALALTLLVHPIGALVALFIIGLFVLRTKERGFLVLLAGITVSWLLLGRLLLPPTSYEQGLYDGVLTGISTGGEQPALDFLFGHSWGHYTTHYAAWWLLLVCTLVLLIRRAAWWTLALVLLACASFIVLTVLTYHRGEAAMMMEKNFLPLAVFVALPLALEVQRFDQAPWWRYVLPFLLVLFVQFRGISFAARPMAERAGILADLVREARATGKGTVQVQADALDARGLHVHWALSYETLLLSGLEGPDQCVMVEAIDESGPVGHVIDASTLEHRWFHPPEGTDRLLSTQ